MKIVSVNCSEIKSINYEGKTITTGIFKKPNLKPVFVDFNGLTGDAQADLVNHGGAHKSVYAFSAHHYGFWREKLARDDIPFGSFGENLTVSHLNESIVCIGDQYQIGECILEVSQPRVPCFKLGIALNNKRAAKLFTVTYNTGVYFRVIKPGHVSVNDSVTKINSVIPTVSVKALFEAKFNKHHTNREDVFRIAREIKELAPEWKDKLN